MKNDKLVSGIIAFCVGLLFVILKDGVISIAMTLFGIGLIVSGIIPLLDQKGQDKTTESIIKIAVGACIIAFGWIFVTIALYVIAVILIAYGALLIYNQVKSKVKDDTVVKTLLRYSTPVVCVVAGILLFFNLGGVMSWVFIVAGVLLLIDGALLIADSLLTKK
jgi:hypothetical protein